MKLIYRLGLIIAGCYFESAVRNSTQLVLYWAGQQDALQGFLPYLLPVFFGYVFALDVRSHWSQSRLKNDIMAYVGSTILVGYPLLISSSLWFAGADVDPTTAKVRIASTVLLFANLAVVALVWRGALAHGFPLSLPWGGVGSKKDEEPAVVAEEPMAEAEESVVEESEESAPIQKPEAPEDKPKD